MGVDELLKEIREEVKKEIPATVEITEDAAHLTVAGVSVTYREYSDDGAHIINGTESITGGGSLDIALTWHSNLTLSGRQQGPEIPAERPAKQSSSLLPEKAIYNRFPMKMTWRNCRRRMRPST